MEPLRTEPIHKHSDERGELRKVHPEAVGGEVYTVTTAVGASRGHHLHRKMGEWFTALAGEGQIVVEDPVTGARRQASSAERRPSRTASPMSADPVRETIC